MRFRALLPIPALGQHRWDFNWIVGINTAMQQRCSHGNCVNLLRSILRVNASKNRKLFATVIFPSLSAVLVRSLSKLEPQLVNEPQQPSVENLHPIKMFALTYELLLSWPKCSGAFVWMLVTPCENNKRIRLSYHSQVRQTVNVVLKCKHFSEMLTTSLGNIDSQKGRNRQ